MADDDDRRFVENEIRIAKENIEKDKAAPGKVLLFGSLAILVISAIVWLSVGQGVGLFLFVAMCFGLWRFLSSMNRLNQERLASHLREIEMRERQLQRMSQG